MTNHDNPLPDGQKPLNEAQPWTATINHQITNNSDLYKYFMSPTITTLNESISAWMRQATCIDVVIPKIAVDMSPITTQAKMIADIIKPDYTNMVAGLAEISKVSLATQAQAIADIIKPDYTDIFANLSEFSTVSMATQAKMIADIIKPNVNAMFASLSALHQPIAQEKLRVASVIATTTRVVHSFDWGIPHDNIRRAMCNRILRKINPDLLESYEGASDTFANRNKEYARHTLISLRNVGEHCMRNALKEYSYKQIIASLSVQNVKKNLYIRKGALSSRGKTLFLATTKPLDHCDNVVIRVGDFFQSVNELHKIKIPLTDERIAELILALDYLILEIFLYWCLPDEITLSA
jgi:hypothetical protein